MSVNRRSELSEFESLEKKSKFIVIIFLIIILIIFLYFIVSFYFGSYFEEIQGAYENSDYLLTGTILMIVRIAVFISLAYILFKKWISHEESHYSDIPFLLGLFFYIFIFGKVMDIVCYSIYANIKYLGDFSELFLLNMAKLRIGIGVVNIFPIFLIGIYFYFFRHSLGKQEFRKEKIARKDTLIFLIIFFSSILIILFLLPNILYLSYLTGFVTFIGFSLLIWVFVTAYKGKILPEINCLIISIGFILLLIFNIIFPIFISLFGVIPSPSQTFAYLTHEGGAITYYTTEGGNLIASVIILIGFERKAPYYKL